MQSLILALSLLGLAATPVAALGAPEEQAEEQAESAPAAEARRGTQSEEAVQETGQVEQAQPQGGALAAQTAATVSHAPAAMRAYNRALRAYLKQDFEIAEELCRDALEIDPDCIEVKWLLACTYEKTGDLGRLLQCTAELGIREARESEYIAGLVRKGSKGYVLSRRGEYATVDLTHHDDVQKGQQLVVYEEGEILRHPVTLEIVDVDQPGRGMLEVVQTYDTHAVARVLEGEGNVMRGMRVIPESQYQRFSFGEVAAAPSAQAGQAGPRFQVVDLSGNYDGSKLSGPEGFFMDADGALFIADTGNDRVVKLDADGSFVAAFGKSGSGEDELRGPVSVARAGTALAVVERANHRVHYLSSRRLRHDSIVGSRGIGAPGRFTTPQKVVAHQGALFVLDAGNRRIQILEPDGTIRDDTVADPSVKYTPVSFAVLGDEIVMLDAVSGQLHRFAVSPPYHHEGVSSLPDGLAGASIVDVSAVRAGGTEYLVLVLDAENRLAIVDAESLDEVTTIGGSGNAAGEFSDPVQVRNVNGVLHVLERGNLRIQVISDYL
jgi:hypothetical protein